MVTNFEPHECVIFAQSTKIGTHKNKAIHSIRQLCSILTSFWTWWLLLRQSFQFLRRQTVKGPSIYLWRYMGHSCLKILSIFFICQCLAFLLKNHENSSFIHYCYFQLQQENWYNHEMLLFLWRWPLESLSKSTFNKNKMCLWNMNVPSGNKG